MSHNEKNKQNRFVPSLESLEDRFLMAGNVTASLSQGVLTIEGTERNDFIVVRQVSTGSGSVIRVDGVPINDRGTIRRIVVNSLGGDDVIRLDANTTAGQSVRIPTLVFAGSGNDLVVGGRGSDELQGGAGNDTLYGLQGIDRLYGQQGGDEIRGGSNADKIIGGEGNDDIWGESGNDTIWGEDGHDAIWGGTGNDVLIGASGNDDIDGGDGDDQIWGGAGTDWIEGGPGKNRIEGTFYLEYKNQGVYVYYGDGRYGGRISTDLFYGKIGYYEGAVGGSFGAIVGPTGQAWVSSNGISVGNGGNYGWISLASGNINYDWSTGNGEVTIGIPGLGWEGTTIRL